jgi:plasmid stabilization system protein ParE
MSKRWSFSQLARNDIASAAEWYESQRSGLGVDFVEAVEDRVLAVQQMPGMATLKVVDGEHLRRVSVPGFPYYFLFVEREGGYLVVTVTHKRRSDAHWRGHAKPPSER